MDQTKKKSLRACTPIFKFFLLLLLFFLSRILALTHTKKKFVFSFLKKKTPSRCKSNFKKLFFLKKKNQKHVSLFFCFQIKKWICLVLALRWTTCKKRIVA